MHSTLFMFTLYQFVLLQVGELIEGIFKLGFWIALIVIIIVAIGVFWLIRKFRR